jgi:DNA polymerase-1
MKATLPTLTAWCEQVVQDAYAVGYVETLTGRRRYLPDLYSDDWGLKKQAERQCVATIGQGSAADIVRRAMLRVRRAVDPQEARILLQVHDELVMERGPAWTDDVLDRIVYECQDGLAEPFDDLPGLELNIPMEFAISVGDSWGDKSGAGVSSYRVMTGTATKGSE